MAAQYSALGVPDDPGGVERALTDQIVEQAGEGVPLPDVEAVVDAIRRAEADDILRAAAAAAHQLSTSAWPPPSSAPPRRSSSTTSRPVFDILLADLHRVADVLPVTTSTRR